MIAVEISGGLGNQLFEYAFIYNQHKRLNTNFFLIKTGTPVSLYQYFELEKNLFYYIDNLFFSYRGFKLFFSHYLRRAFYSIILKLTIKKQLTVDNRENPTNTVLGFTDSTLYRGYFQSEIYHADYKRNFPDIFKIKSKYSRAFLKRFFWLSKQQRLVAIHIRKTDYKTDLAYLNLGGDDLSLPLRYYHDLIRKVHHEDNFYVILSDEIEVIKGEFGYLKNIYFSKEDEITDFQLMMHADICIIANSTFSWWASYLNRKENKIIYCPKHFLGFLAGVDYPEAIYPASWIQVPVV
jgi:hypothetical protein